MQCLHGSYHGSKWLGIKRIFRIQLIQHPEAVELTSGIDQVGGSAITSTHGSCWDLLRGNCDLWDAMGDAVLEQWLEATQRTVEGNRSHRTLIWLEVGIGQDTRFERHYHGGNHIRKGLKPEKLANTMQILAVTCQNWRHQNHSNLPKSAELIWKSYVFHWCIQLRSKKKNFPLPAPRLRLQAHPCHLRLMVGAPIHIWTGKFLWRDGLYPLDMFLNMV